MRLVETALFWISITLFAVWVEQVVYGTNPPPLWLLLTAIGLFVAAFAQIEFVKRGERQRQRDKGRVLPPSLISPKKDASSKVGFFMERTLTSSFKRLMDGQSVSKYFSCKTLTTATLLDSEMAQAFRWLDSNHGRYHERKKPTLTVFFIYGLPD